MSIAIEKWNVELAALTAQDRAELAHFLIESLEPESDTDAAWDVELSRRADEIKSGKAEGQTRRAGVRRAPPEVLVKPVVFHREAEQEFAAAVEYYERPRAGLGLDFQSEVERGVEMIQQEPLRWPLYKDSGVRKYRLKRFLYSLYNYMELEDRIWMAAVAHQKRQPRSWARRSPE
jgi:toxin ParE1/3/4